MTIRFTKALQSEADPFTFVASTDAVDRMGDVIDQNGWKLADFRKNPIALWMHNHEAPIGVWENIKVEAGKLVAKLKLAALGTNATADMVRALIEQRILRAVSVGFLPIEYEPIKDAKGQSTGGYRFTKVDLLEISVVSVPAQPEALALAQAKGMSATDLARFFSPPGMEDPIFRERKSGPPARTTPPSSTRNTKMTLAERIAAAEAELTKHKDALTAITEKEAQTDEDIVAMDELSGQIDVANKSIESLKRAQAALAASATPAGGTRSAPGIIKARSNGDLFTRAALAAIRAHVEHKALDEIIRRDFAGARDLEVVARAATSPAETTVTGWAAELVGDTMGSFMNNLRPESIFFNMPQDSFSFAGSNIKLPGRGATNDLAGGFVGEGAPIPVKQALFASVLLTPHKLGVITTLTRELAAMSTPAAEPLLRSMMVGDTRETIDAIYLDNNPAVVGIRPQGLQTMATGQDTRASAGTTLADIITDLRNAIDGMTSRNMGGRPVWIMNTSRLLSLRLVTNAAGSFMFRDELATGRLLGIPVLSSTIVPSSVVFLVDGSHLAAAYDPVPTVDVSEQATLHMESSAPLPLATGAQGSAVVATPQRSMFQTASLALRLLWDMTWVLRRPGAVQTVTGVAW
jgi:HK97 family phage major capsid protein/HK97 family phage prohead protease